MWPLLIFAALIFLAPAAVFAQVALSQEENTITVDDAPDMEVFSYGKTVIVRNRAKGVLTFGGDVIVEGRVEGDVAAVGGTVIQKETGYVGGDIIILGGRYKPESANPLRAEGKETIMYAGYEEELRGLIQNPASLFSPSFSPAFFAQWALSVLFWFLVSLGLTALAPGAVGRAIARIQLSSLKVVGLGIATFLMATIVIIASASLLPNYLTAVLSLTAFAMLMLAYVFGRVTLHLSAGKFIQKHFLPQDKRSETLAILFGVVAWSLILSIPFAWAVARILLLSAGIGLLLTGRTNSTWRSR